MGQANVWYADTPEAKPLIKKVKSFLKGKPVNVLPKAKKTDPEKNARVEKSAIKTTTKYFQNIGYTVDSVEKDNVGWDLEAVSKKNKLVIEVKGLSGTAVTVGLSPNEYVAFLKNSNNYRLCIVTSALNNPTLFICRYSSESDKWVVEGNKKAKLDIKPKQSAIITVRI
ncbi:MAG: DUF3883 domain-containing protein [Porticoccaceae bacterium]|nr:DUF3883 domain-containing protein [Porticoccaceae bacterium]